MLANRSSLCKPLILDILLLYLKLKMTFTICEITNRMGPISLFGKFWNYIYIKGKKKPEYLLKTFSLSLSLFFSCIALNLRGGHLVRARSNAPTISLPSQEYDHYIFLNYMMRDTFSVCKARCSERNIRVTDRAAGWAPLTTEIALP